MITIDKSDDGLPVSVIIPHTPKRKKFFEQFVLPSIEGMNPIEIIINDNLGTAPKKRNEGFKESTQKYVLFSDDDIVFPVDFLEKMVDVLESNPEIGYAYSGYHGIVMPTATNHSVGQNFTIPTTPFNPHRLRQMNYISTMSLIRREVFPGFDENLKRLQDWSLWLTLLEKNIYGIAVPGVEYHAYFIDEGITSNTNSFNDAYLAIKAKHHI